MKIMLFYSLPKSVEKVGKYQMFILPIMIEWCLILASWQKMKTILANFTTFHLMKGMINYFNTLYEMYVNNEDATLMPYFAIVGT